MNAGGFGAIRLWTKDARVNAPNVRLTAADDSMRFRLDCCGFVVE
jgi:hypothetical protein